MGGNPTAVNGKCPDGYTHVFGPLCVEHTTLDKAKDMLPDLPEIPDFTSAPCEAALTAIKEVSRFVNEALRVPQQIMRMAQRLLDYPFEKAQELVDNALSALDDVAAAIDDLLSLGGALDELRQALEKALECPFFADSQFGALAAGILDAMDRGLPITDMIEDLKYSLSSAAGDALDALKETPAEALSNMNKLVNDAIQRSGVHDLLSQLEALESCVEAACKGFDVAKRLPEKAQQVVDHFGGNWDKTTGTITAAAAKPVTAAQQTAADVAKDVGKVKNSVKLTGKW